MGVNEYREFIELARCLNFTTAAQHLNITQPALSKHVAALEREFTAELFLRDRHGLQLTPAGKIVLEMSTAIIDAYDHAQRNIAHLTKATPVLLDGILYDSVISSIVSLAVAQLSGSDGAPPVLLSHHEGAHAVDLLIEGTIDIALSYTGPSELELNGLGHRRLTRTQFVALLDREHPLATRSELHMEDLRDEVFVQCIDEYASSGWACIERACLSHGFRPKKRPVLGGPTMYSVIQPNGGVFIQQRNKHQNKLLQDNGGIVIVPVVDEDAHFDIDCIYRLDDEQRLAPVLDALEEARDIVARRRGSKEGPRG